MQNELKILEYEAIIASVDHSVWAPPIVPVFKADEKKNVRICGDYKLRVNPAVIATQYPLSKVVNIFCKVHSCSQS